MQALGTKEKNDFQVMLHQVRRDKVPYPDKYGYSFFQFKREIYLHERNTLLQVSENT
jgi:hypothetical protein